MTARTPRMWSHPGLMAVVGTAIRNRVLRHWLLKICAFGIRWLSRRRCATFL